MSAPGAGEDTAVIDQVLPVLEKIAATTYDLEVLQKITAAVARHGSGPYPPDELAVLGAMATEGLTRPATPEPDDPGTN